MAAPADSDPVCESLAQCLASNKCSKLLLLLSLLLFLGKAKLPIGRSPAFSFCVYVHAAVTSGGWENPINNGHAFSVGDLVARSQKLLFGRD